MSISVVQNLYNLFTPRASRPHRPPTTFWGILGMTLETEFYCQYNLHVAYINRVDHSNGRLWSRRSCASSKRSTRCEQCGGICTASMMGRVGMHKSFQELLLEYGMILATPRIIEALKATILQEVHEQLVSRVWCLQKTHAWPFSHRAIWKMYSSNHFHTFHFNRGQDGSGSTEFDEFVEFFRKAECARQQHLWDG